MDEKMWGGIRLVIKTGAILFNLYLLFGRLNGGADPWSMIPAALLAFLWMIDLNVIQKHTWESIVCISVTVLLLIVCGYFGSDSAELVPASSLAPAVTEAPEATLAPASVGEEESNVYVLHGRMLHTAPGKGIPEPVVRWIVFGLFCVVFAGNLYVSWKDWKLKGVKPKPPEEDGDADEFADGGSEADPAGRQKDQN